ncbi:MAG TPA: hypothetical protein H9744_14415 [Candidatus Eisenbergiella stercoravium]|nr:hypothetical protein [Candidatus Eisenbergiella stercoravium]
MIKNIFPTKDLLILNSIPTAPLQDSPFIYRLSDKNPWQFFIARGQEQSRKDSDFEATVPESVLSCFIFPLLIPFEGWQ